MWVYDPETLAFLEINDAAIQQYGFSRDEFLRMTIRDIRPGSEIPRLLHRLRDTADRSAVSATMRRCSVAAACLRASSSLAVSTTGTVTAGIASSGVTVITRSCPTALTS